MDIYCQHQKICYNGLNEYIFFTWSIPEISMMDNLNNVTGTYKMHNGSSYYPILSSDKDKITFGIESDSNKLKCSVSVIVGSKTILLSNSLNKHTSTSKINYLYYSYDLVTLSSEDETFQKLKQDPNNTLDFICKIIYLGGSVSTISVKTFSYTSKDNLRNLKSLAAVLRNSSESSLKEKVLLKVGEETQILSKSVLCSRSSVFAKMFENDMKEGQENVVTITDIKMPVLKILVSFLYTGKISNCDFDLLCDLYYAADKYDIAELRQICVNSIISKISMNNIHRVLKIAFAHDDKLLKSTVMALIATNIETWFSTNNWINLVNEEPKIAAEVLNFFDF